MRIYKIILVDDDADDREIMQSVLDSKGFSQHLILSSAAEVFAYLEQVEGQDDLPQLIMTDLNMPGKNGIELLRELKSQERYSAIDVMVYSTSSMSTQIELCLALGAKDYLPKPQAMDGYEQLADRITQTVAQKTAH